MAAVSVEPGANRRCGEAPLQAARRLPNHLRQLLQGPLALSASGLAPHQHADHSVAKERDLVSHVVIHGCHLLIVVNQGLSVSGLEIPVDSLCGAANACSARRLGSWLVARSVPRLPRPIARVDATEEESRAGSGSCAYPQRLLPRVDEEPAQASSRVGFVGAGTRDADRFRLPAPESPGQLAPPAPQASPARRLDLVVREEAADLARRLPDHDREQHGLENRPSAVEPARVDHVRQDARGEPALEAPIAPDLDDELSHDGRAQPEHESPVSPVPNDRERSAQVVTRQPPAAGASPRPKLFYGRKSSRVFDQSVDDEGEGL